MGYILISNQIYDMLLVQPSAPQAIRPILHADYLHNRNQYHKNYGLLQPTRFEAGTPKYIFPPVINVTAFAIYLVILLMLNGFADAVVTILKCAIVVGIVIAYVMVCRTGHGIASSGLPILNQETFRNYRGFCQPCRIFTDGSHHFNNNTKQLEEQQHKIIKHCPECKVCFYQPYFHSKMLGICVTQINFYHVLVFNLLCLLEMTVTAVGFLQSKKQI